MAETMAGVNCILDGLKNVLRLRGIAIRVVEVGGDGREEYVIEGAKLRAAAGSVDDAVSMLDDGVLMWIKWGYLYLMFWQHVRHRSP